MRAMVTVMLLAAVMATGCNPTPTPERGPATTATPDDPVPAFTFTERSGTTVTHDSLKGKVWIASFVFTRCNGPCPQVTATMARVQEDLKEFDDVRLVTFTIDPERDTLKDLNQYADRYRADAKRWLFLTGPEKQVHALAKDGFKLLAERSATPKPGEEFDHSSKIAVVDKAGVIRGYFNGKPDADPTEAEATIQRLVAKVKSLRS
jgi:cytochrome oxidase Cu insertion factor (SCO1/SenC/PrrC family)